VTWQRLIVAGTDDPIIPLVNAKLMYLLLPHATLHLHDGGHLELITNAAQLAPLIERSVTPRCHGDRRARYVSHSGTRAGLTVVIAPT
jgi:hypothetical protein